MFAVLEMGSLLKGRYFIQHLLKPGERDRVYLALDQLQSGEICWVGELIANNAEEAARIATTFAPQLDRLKTLFHPQIQQLKEYWWQDEHLFFVQSYIEGSTARDRGPGTAAFNEPEIRQLLQQILPVLEVVGTREIVHGDISPNNLQWKNPDNLPTLINFGVFRDIKTQLGIDPLEKKFSDRLRELPLGFLPPGPSEDLYALAVTAVVLLTGQDIGVLFNPQTQTWNWEDYKLVSDQLANALNRMLSPQASDRFPTATAMLHALNAPVAAPTFMPPPPPPAYQPPTPISTPPVGTVVASVPPSSAASGLKDWQKAAIAGGIIGAFVLGGMLLLRPSIWSQQVVEEVQEEGVEESPQVSNQVNSLGWIRIGAVENTSGIASVGESLIETTQPVTISPPIVPSLNETVTIINPVNLRESYPQAPDYKLANRVAALVAGQSIVILRLEAFVDSTTASPYTVVWAEIKLPN